MLAKWSAASQKAAAASRIAIQRRICAAPFSSASMVPLGATCNCGNGGKHLTHHRALPNDTAATASCSRKYMSTFVSSHYRMPEPSNVPEYLDRRNFVYRDTPTHYIVKYCPMCSKPHNEKIDNLFKLYIRKADGAYFCHRCGAGGSWYDFKAKLGDTPTIDSSSTATNTTTSAAARPSHTNNPWNSNKYGESLDLLQSAAMQGDGMEMVVHSPAQSSPAEFSLSSTAKRISLPDVIQARDDLLKHDKHDQVLEYLTVKRGIKPAVLELYGVGAVTRRMISASQNNISQLLKRTTTETELHECIVFPWLNFRAAGRPSSDPWGTEGLICDRVKLRSITDKSKQLLLPRGGSWGMFGWHTIPASASCIVITEGELDALSVYQETGMPAVSLPNGCRSFPIELVQWLERFEKIYLWMDDDVGGREGADKISMKLGMGRCNLVSPRNVDWQLSGDGVKHAAPPKDANEALQRKLDLRAIILASSPRPHDEILSFKDIRTEALREVAATYAGALSAERAKELGVSGMSASGIPFRSLPQFQRLIKGHRKGEMTILTGPTGCGKTTLLSQLSLDLAAQGVRTLWGSFEIKASRLIATMLHQLRSERIQLAPELASQLGVQGDDIVDVHPGDGTQVNPLPYAEDDFAAFERAADVLGQLPLQFLRFYGSTDVERVLDALEYAAYVHDVEHVILDNLQFMMSASTVGRGMERFDIQERALDKFRTFATKHDVHLTLVIHPRKEAEDAPLGLASIFGSAKATQEADSVVILQKTPEGRKYIDVKKNRYDGTLGLVPLMYEKEYKTFAEDDGVVAGAASLAGNGSAGRPGAPSPATPGRGPRAPPTGRRAFSTSTYTPSQRKPATGQAIPHRNKFVLRKQFISQPQHRQCMALISREINEALVKRWSNTAATFIQVTEPKAE